MHVVMVSDALTFGGAAMAATRLAQGLVAQGVRVTRVVNRVDEPVDNAGYAMRVVDLSRVLGSMDSTLRRALRYRGWRAVFEWAGGRAWRLMLRELKPDVVNLHNIHPATQNQLWPLTVLDVSMGLGPCVWTLHDQWSFTGRCAYAYGCRKFETGCDASCPTPHEYPQLRPQWIAGAWRRRRALLRRHAHVAAVTPSRWLAAEAQRGLWAGHPVVCIPYALDVQAYSPPAIRPKRDVAHLLFVAAYVEDPRKGVGLLMDALAQLRSRPVVASLMGHPPRQGLPAIEGVTWNTLGYLTSTQAKAAAYRDADVLVHPATADNLPNTVMESLACGTPVAAFDVGGLPDMVRPGVSGALASEVTSSALARAIDAVLAGPPLHTSCRTLAEAEYAPATQAGRYVELFESLLSKGARR